MTGATGYGLHVARDYALIADGERGAIMGPRGEVVWLCAPRWDSPAVFSRLLGGDSLFAITPDADDYVWGGYYEPGTLVWHSRWVEDAHIVECQEALAFPGEQDRLVLLRRVVAGEGDCRVRIVLHPRPGYGRHRVSWSRSGRTLWEGHGSGLSFRVQGLEDARLSADGGLEAVLTVAAGEQHDVVLEIAGGVLAEEPAEEERLWTATRERWRSEVPETHGTVADRDVHHARAVLRGLTSSHGGMVAAATMSLPERAEQGRNYDYRYAWIRDQCFTGQSMASLGDYALLDNAVSFVADRLQQDGPGLKPAYAVDGGPVPDEKRLPLPGYPGGVAIAGNRANQQFQLDAFGEALSLFGTAARLDRLDVEMWPAVEVAVDAIAARWDEPDAGIWELKARWWTHSRLACVAGLRAVAAHAPSGRGAQWAALADRILAEVGNRGVHASGRWQRAADDPGIDAALLLPAIRGAVAWEDPRALSTVSAALGELASEEYLYRFPQNGQLGDEEGAFLLCSLMMALSLHQQGRDVEATRWFERVRGCCGPAGLFSEEWDVLQRQSRGNVPQAFVHAFFAETARALAEPHRDHSAGQA
ncbi:glycoside hydrolase family 15 protein [Gryllotalpicola reticulitermitis]|uniref:Glycoside hydrolase family 15 protein n=1 Tax=Gryllotalpicola reticulitermitis TaxID=1184153 RepID=A0ABV8QC97_9MICO